MAKYFADLTTPGRMTLAEKMAETRLADLKEVDPKLPAFYDSLDAKQKKAFDTGGRIGGIFDLWARNEGRLESAASVTVN